MALLGVSRARATRTARASIQDNRRPRLEGFLLKRKTRTATSITADQPHHRLYTQAQCTIALCELYGMTQDCLLREPAERAINTRSAIQDKRRRLAVLSRRRLRYVGHRLVRHGAAKRPMAKLDVPQETLDNITRFLDTVQVNGGSEYTYQPDTFSTPAVTAEGLLCRQYLGWKQNDPRLVEGVDSVLNGIPSITTSHDRDVYYWYYATQACHHMEGNTRIWNDWNKVMRQEVPAAPDQRRRRSRKLGPQRRQVGHARRPAVRDLPVDLHARSLLPALADLLGLPLRTALSSSVPHRSR